MRSRLLTYATGILRFKITAAPRLRKHPMNLVPRGKQICSETDISNSSASVWLYPALAQGDVRRLMCASCHNIEQQLQFAAPGDAAFGRGLSVRVPAEPDATAASCRRAGSAQCGTVSISLSRCTLPDGPRGKSGTKRISLGVLKRPRCSSQKASSSCSVQRKPSRSTTQAMISWP